LTSWKKSSSNDVLLPVVQSKCFPETWLPFTHTGLREAGFWRPTVLLVGARQRTGWGRWWHRHKVLEGGSRIISNMINFLNNKEITLAWRNSRNSGVMWRGACGGGRGVHKGYFFSHSLIGTITHPYKPLHMSLN
jgi:hypothetical protein